MAKQNVKTDKAKLIQSLSPDDAYGVLMILLRDNPDLEEPLYQIAAQILNDVDSDEIMDDVYYELDSLDVDDLYNRSGKTRYGYVEPSEEAWEMIEAAIEPFIDKMKKSQERVMPFMAKTYCAGIIKGLQKFGGESNSDFLDWAQDAPGEEIEKVFSEWKKGLPSDEDIADILTIIDKPAIDR
jgi:hypothetical protein